MEHERAAVVSAQRSTKQPAWLRALNEQRRSDLLEHVRAKGGERGVVTTHAQLSGDLGVSQVAIQTSLRHLRRSDQIEIVGERGEPSIRVRALERSS